MTEKIVAFNENRPGVGLPAPVEKRMGGIYSRHRDLPAPAKAAVVIMWDDGYKEVWDDLRPLLLDRPHHKHAFAIFLDGIDGYRQSAPTFMNAEQVATLAAEGHEICSHAVTENPHIRDLPAEDRVFEYDESKARLEEITGQQITTWVYPNGRNSRSMLTDRELFLRYGRVMSNVDGVPFTIPGRTGHYVRRLLWGPGSHERVKSVLWAAAENGMTVCLSAHKPGGVADLSMAQIEEVLDLIDSLNIRTILPREAYPSPASILINPGFEDGRAGWTVITSGTGAGEVVEDDTPVPGLPGTKALRMWSTTDGTSDWAYTFQTVPVIPGETYTFAALVKGAKTGTGANVALRVSTQTWEPGSQARTVTSDTQAVTDDWQLIQMDFVPNPDELMAMVQLRLPPAHGGEVLYDRVSFAPKQFGVFV